uniref:Uncharacterized protein n=1 Tax=Glossina palpalis gambiensis TaxID=67801 RepID=A0A1B0AQ23_9MUSC
YKIVSIIVTKKCIQLSQYPKKYTLVRSLYVSECVFSLFAVMCEGLVAFDCWLFARNLLPEANELSDSAILPLPSNCIHIIGTLQAAMSGGMLLPTPPCPMGICKGVISNAVISSSPPPSSSRKSVLFFHLLARKSSNEALPAVGAQALFIKPTDVDIRPHNQTLYNLNNIFATAAGTQVIWRPLGDIKIMTTKQIF